MIKKFKITGLFGFRNVDINFENNVKILIGENGFGKTTVLNSLYYLLNKKIEKYQKRLEDASTASSSKDNDTPITLYTLASMYHDKLMDYEKTLIQYQRILNEFPHCDFAELVQYMVGDCYENMKHFELAINEYQKYLERYPNGKQSEMLHQKIKELELLQKKDIA